jgi:hypothetical protein
VLLGGGLNQPGRPIFVGSAIWQKV